MSTVNYRAIQLVIGSLLLLNTAYLFLVKPDWWIYGWLSLLAGLLNVVSRPECKYWRLTASFVIVLGTMETLFLTWTMRLLEQAPVVVDSSATTSPAYVQLPEGRHILLTSIATLLTISTRLRSAQHTQFLDYFRTLVILVLVALILPNIAYSVVFYVPQVANLVPHILT